MIGNASLAVFLTLAATSVLAAPVAATPLGNWSLDEGAGQVTTDLTGNGHEGRLGASPGPDGNDPSWIAGRFGNGLRFAGDQDQHVMISAPETLNPQEVTASAWVRRLGTPGTWRYVISNGAVGCEFASYGLYTGFNGGLAFYVSDDAHYVLSPEADPGAIWDGAWHHALGTYDGERVRLYLDGSQIGAGTATGLKIAYASPATGAYVGTYRGSCERPFTGDVDEVAIEDGARGGQQIAADFARDANRPLPLQSVPVSGPPAVGVPKVRSRCLSIAVAPKRLVTGRRTLLALTVRNAHRALVGKRISIRGLGIKRSVRTRRGGRVRLYVRVTRPGLLRLHGGGQPSHCARAVPVTKRN